MVPDTGSPPARWPSEGVAPIVGGGAEQSVMLVDVDVDGADRAELVAFPSGHRFPFHVTPAPSADVIERQLAEGRWGGVADEEGAHRTLWVVRDDERVGWSASTT